MIDNDYDLCLSNVVGKYVKVPHELKFSFNFSDQCGWGDDIRVRPEFNSKRLLTIYTGKLELHGDWKFTPGVNDRDVPEEDIEEMKAFFKEYIVLFCMVWDFQLDAYPVQAYFHGWFELCELIKEIDFYSKEMDNISSIKELEEYCRKNGLVNFYGN